MSRFLGPIHYWLFNKIEVFEEMEQDLVNAFQERFGEDVLKLVAENQRQHGPAVRGQNLEEIIDQANIHGWLQGRITAAETRHAAILTAIFNKYGKPAIELAKDVTSKHAKKAGMEAKTTKPVGSAPELFKTLNDYILDGMPCDNINRLTLQEPDHVEWEHAECLHIRYWHEAKADPQVFYELRRLWVKNFIENANPAFQYQFSQKNGTFRHSILTASPMRG